MQHIFTDCIFSCSLTFAKRVEMNESHSLSIAINIFWSRHKSAAESGITSVRELVAYVRAVLHTVSHHQQRMDFSENLCTYLGIVK